MVNSVEFGKRLQKIMSEYDLTAAAFADKIDVGRSSISHILSGRNKPSLEFVLKITQAFPEVELYWLLNGKGQFPKRKEYESDKAREIKPSMVTEPSNITPTPSPLSKVKTTESREISRIVIFYSDGSFESFES